MSNPNYENQGTGIESLFSGAQVQYEPQSTKPERRVTFKRTLRGMGRVAIGTAITASVIGAGVFSAGVVYAGIEKPETAAHVINPGKGKIVYADANIQPITIGTFKTYVTGVTSGIDQKLSGPITIPLGTDSLAEDALVTSEVTVDPKKVTISYDGKELIYDADGAVRTKVSIAPGEHWPGKPKNSLVTGFMNAISGPTTNLAQTLDGTFGSGFSELPLISDAIGQKESMHQVLQNLDDFNAMVSVDQQCTPEAINHIDNYEQLLKDNIREGVGDQADSPDKPTDVSKALADLKNSEVTKLKKHAVVKINFTNIGPDQKNIDTLARYNKMFTTSFAGKTKMECAVGKDVTVSSSNNGGNSK